MKGISDFKNLSKMAQFWSKVYKIQGISRILLQNLKKKSRQPLVDFSNNTRFEGFFCDQVGYDYNIPSIKILRIWTIMLKHWKVFYENIEFVIQALYIGVVYRLSIYRVSIEIKHAWRTLEWGPMFSFFIRDLYWQKKSNS